MKQIKIKIMTEAAFGACSWYRSWGVLSKLKHIMPDCIIQIDPLDLKDWHSISDTDIVFFERPGQWHFEPGIQLIKDFGVKLWMDFDDDFFNVPIKPFNPSGNHYADPKVRKMIAKYISMSDVVTVSTEAILKSYAGLNENLILVPNAFNDYNYEWKYNPSTREGVFWRGSIFHRFNIKVAKDAILNVHRSNKNWKWTFIGEGAADVWSEMDKANLVYDQPMIKFLKILKNIDCSIQIFPLVNDLFNQAKSNCSWIEGTWAGASMLAPDYPEFRRPGITNYTDINQFKDKLEMMMSTPEYVKECYDISFDYIKENLLLSTVNQQRADIIFKLLGDAR